MTEKPSSVFVTYIVTTPEKLWEALTNGDCTKQYFFGRRMESDWKVSSPFKLVMEDGHIDSQGKVLESEPPRRLALTWHVEWMGELRHLPAAIVTFQIDMLGEVVRFTVKEFHPEGLSKNTSKVAAVAGPSFSVDSRPCWKPAVPCESLSCPTCLPSNRGQANGWYHRPLP